MDSDIFQFTPLREGRLLLLLHWKKSARISIHAPPRGATLYYPPFGVIQLISIHAPPRGATSTDRNVANAVSISIHAPPRGATGALARRACAEPYFNSRPSARGDTHSSLHCVMPFYFNSRPSARGDTVYLERRAINQLFQFTPLREGRRKSGRCSWSYLYFNSRPSARGDNRCVKVFTTESISIHAPPRGATRTFNSICRNGDISIHAPPRGATESNG